MSDLKQAEPRPLTYGEQQAIDESVEHMHLERVHRAMAAVGWKWYRGKDADGADIMLLPTLAELEKALRRLCAEAIRGKTSIGSGGFNTYYDGEHLACDFTFDSWEAKVIEWGESFAQPAAAGRP